MTAEELTRLLQDFFQSTTDDEALALFQSVVQWSAIVLSALAGVYAARQRGMEFFLAKRSNSTSRFNKVFAI